MSCACTVAYNIAHPSKKSDGAKGWINIAGILDGFKSKVTNPRFRLTSAATGQQDEFAVESGQFVVYRCIERTLCNASSEGGNHLEARLRTLFDNKLKPERTFGVAGHEGSLTL